MRITSSGIVKFRVMGILLLAYLSASSLFTLSAAAEEGATTDEATTTANTANVSMANEKAIWTLNGVMSGEANINISGIAKKGDLLVIGTDEGAHIQVFKKKGETEFMAVPGDAGIIVLDDGETEADIEGLAWVGEHIYAIGSHSIKRKKVKRGKSHKKNLKRLAKVEVEPTRDRIFRLKLNTDGTLVPGSIERASLGALLDRDPVLSRFRSIPSKENGIDIEGLAIAEEGKKLVAGLRGPSLRGPYAIVLMVSREDSKSIDNKALKTKKLDFDILHVDLGGRGIRGISEIAGGYLILAGPVGDEPSSYQIFFWDGESSVPGLNPGEAGSHVAPLCIVPPVEPAPEAKKDGVSIAKAEGIQLLTESGGKIEFVVVYDSGRDGRPTVYTCPFTRG